MTLIHGECNPRMHCNKSQVQNGGNIYIFVISMIKNIDKKCNLNKILKSIILLLIRV